jgi:hypothetical protein
VPARKFQEGDRVKGKEEAPASFRDRMGQVVGYQSRGDYAVLFDDTSVKEYVDATWIELAS